MTGTRHGLFLLSTSASTSTSTSFTLLSTSVLKVQHAPQHIQHNLHACNQCNTYFISFQNITSKMKAVEKKSGEGKDTISKYLCELSRQPFPHWPGSPGKPTLPVSSTRALFFIPSYAHLLSQYHDLYSGSHVSFP